ncbi:zinc finger protein 260-like [Condylostylus longicornis]|uniref:zinc finger protein 260-like n=1 Tax=Condylostylus longicornis TaxID=2530218 RepID=UPI00244D9B77|nr:zinc finger protein 260-like [Condylostylus longicornis]
MSCNFKTEDEFSGISSNSRNSSSDENDEKLPNEIIKIEIETDCDSDDKIFRTETVTTIRYCQYCELSFRLDEKHDCEKCEIIQKRIAKHDRNLKFLQIEGIYLCKDCPRYYENVKDLQNHEKTHVDNITITEKNHVQNRNNNISADINGSCTLTVDVKHNENGDDFENKNYSEFEIFIKCKNCGKHLNEDNEIFQFKNLCSDCDKSREIDGNSEASISENETCLKEYFQGTRYSKKNENSIKCPHCNIKFKDTQNHDQSKCLKVQKLIKINAKNCYEALQNKGIYLCRECPRFFNNENELISHRKKHYNNGQCTICFKSFKGIDIIEHIKVQHPDCYIKGNSQKSNSKKSYECSYCKRQFVSLIYWKRHLLVHQSNELKCEFCNKVCQSSIILKNHIRTHTGERPFICQLCPAAFSLKHNLDLHFIYKHTDERPFECRYDGGCGKTFKTDQLRNYHERRHTGEILGKCEICGIEYRNKSAFRKHMKLRHMSYNERPYQCEYCDKKFVEHGRLKEHVRTHTGEKPLQCDICFKGFARYSVLREHKKLHTGKKNHVCSRCGKAFAQTAGYFNHLKNHA